MLASFVHIHFGSCPALAAQLVGRCADVDATAVSAAAGAAAEGHAGPRSFPLDSSSIHCNGGLHGVRNYKSANVSPDSGPSMGGSSRPIFPVSALKLGSFAAVPHPGQPLLKMLSFLPLTIKRSWRKAVLNWSGWKCWVGSVLTKGLRGAGVVFTQSTEPRQGVQRGDRRAAT